MKNLSTGQIINIILLILLVVFIGQNLQMIEVSFLFISFSLPLIVIILFCLIVGYVSALLFSKKKDDAENKEA